MEIKTFVDFGKEKQLAPNLLVRIERTDNPKRVFVRIGDKPEKHPPSIRHRKYRPRRDRT